ncbi:hypothetical protein VP01_138g4 [Puccinia sorghi]|uniref:Glucanase n=1 Tax=Puccinia sorghi TaxID=27349 RepID=A0A0L6VL69_9BASI|nr:hypothetical protein VP01_138g4 [Puccinia sorghi]
MVFARRGIVWWMSCLSAMRIVDGQSASRREPEANLAFDIETCTVADGCRKVPGKLTLDADWRAVKDGRTGQKDCLDRQTGQWDQALCPDPLTCAQNCALGRVDYSQERITTNSLADSLDLKLFKPEGHREGSRLYLLDQQDQYRLFFLLNKELAFDIDVSNAPCGVAPAVYFSAMKGDGGASPSNTAGPTYGTGYCDAQGPRNMHFVQGKANLAGEVGYACPELDIWEGNSISQSFAVHNCDDVDARTCSGKNCGKMCDGSGCDFASYRMGNTSFYGPLKRVDTTKKFTVVTQFITADQSDSGELVEIRRYYRQAGRRIENSLVEIPSAGTNGSSRPLRSDSLSDQFCDQVERSFGRTDGFRRMGGMRKMGQSLAQGMVLVFTIWADHVRGMSWLDGIAPHPDPLKPGSASRGTCPPGVGLPSNIKKLHPDAGAVFSNIRVGPIGSTYRN